MFAKYDTSPLDADALQKAYIAACQVNPMFDGTPLEDIPEKATYVAITTYLREADAPTPK